MARPIGSDPTPDAAVTSLFLCLQTEIAKRLNAILAQVMPFLSQEVSVDWTMDSEWMKWSKGVDESDKRRLFYDVQRNSR